jgi:hypothetical protein
MPDDIKPPPTSARTPSGSGGIGGWVGSHKGIAIGGGIAALVGAYLIIRSRKSSSTATSSTTAAGGTAQTVYPTSSGITGDTNQGDYYAGILNQLNSNDSALSSQLTGLGTSITSAINAGTAAANPSTGATNTGSASGSSVPAYQTINLPGIGQADVLGQIGANGQYTGYNVGGGAPVYFGNANAVAQGPQGEQPGNYAYTPVQYQGLIGSSKTTEIL